VIFALVVRNFRWLAKVPGMPHVFDAALLLSTVLLRPARLRAISAVEKNAQRLPGVTLGVHRLGGVGFFFHGKESSHIHGNGLLDCFVGRPNRDELVRDRRACPHHIFPRSGWISFWIRDGDDVQQAVDLIRIACAYGQSAI
jgi:hypothetical protein